MGKNNKRCLSKFITATMVMISLTATDKAYAKDTSSYVKSFPNKIVSSINLYQYNEQAIYNKIYDSISKLEDVSDVSKYVNDANVDAKKACDVFYKVLNDHPEIFYVSKEINYNYGKDGNGNPMLKLNIKYNFSEDEIKNKVITLDKEVNRIISKYINSSMTDLEKEIAIHDYLVLNTKYDQENYEKNTVPDISHTAYGNLINHISVCDGYSKAFKLLLSKVGINSIIVSSEQMHHAWNIVTLNNHNYQVDVTWDDPTPDREGKVRYRYFNLDDDSIKKDFNPHRWDESKYPKCNDNKYSYLSNMDNVINKNNTLYYINSASGNDFKLYKCNVDGTAKKQLTNNNAESFVIVGDSIYYTNFSNGGYIHKIKTDGTDDQLFKKVSARNLTLENNKLAYEDDKTKQKNIITLNTPILQNGWKEENNFKVYYKDGNKVTGLKNIEGKIYLFNADGQMQIGWQIENSKKYYFDNTGQAITGEKNIEDKIYQFDNNGILIKEVVKPKEEHKEVKPTSSKEDGKDKTKTSEKEKQKETVKPKEEHKEVKPTSSKEEGKDKTKTSEKEKQKVTVKPKEANKEVKPTSSKEDGKDKTKTSEKEKQKETVKPKEEHKEVKPTSSKEEGKDKTKTSEKEKQKETVKPKEANKEVKPTSSKEDGKDKTKTSEKEKQKETIKPKEDHKEVKPTLRKGKETIKLITKQEKNNSNHDLVLQNNEINLNQIKSTSNHITKNKMLNVIENNKIQKDLVSNQNILEKDKNEDTNKTVDNKDTKTKETNIVETKKTSDEKISSNKDDNKKETSTDKKESKGFFETILCAIKEIFEKIMSIFK